MVGVSGRLLTRGAATLRLKGEWVLAQMDVARTGTAFEAATMNTRRLRLGTEVSRQHVCTPSACRSPRGRSWACVTTEAAGRRAPDWSWAAACATWIARRA